MNKTHPLPVERIDRLDRAMGTQMDALAVADVSVPSFAQPLPVIDAKPAGLHKHGKNKS